MANKNFNITSSAITWDCEQTEVTQDEVAFVDITCAGTIDSKGCTIDNAVEMIPNRIPIGSSGPVRNATKYSGAQLQKKKAKFGDGNILVEAVYRKPVALVYSGPGNGQPDTAEQESASDKRSLRIVASSIPLLSHPVVRLFSKEDRRALKNLLEGDIKPNDEQRSKPWKAFEYVKLEPESNEWSIEHKFGTDSFTANGVTASPADYARLLVAGVEEYKEKSISYKWSSTRDTPASSSEMNSVGTVVKPPGAPDVADREWLFEGLNQDQITDSTYTIDRDFELSGPGGWLKKIYKGGHGSLE